MPTKPPMVCLNVFFFVSIMSMPAFDPVLSKHILPPLPSVPNRVGYVVPAVKEHQPASGCQHISDALLTEFDVSACFMSISFSCTFG